ncbi:RNA12 protein-domain-containing protein [Kockovaella imperatae]|uniref:Mitochondrial escape protein 2 n=1 Tax=Kockovaella imperatae TaxID=4999 RepID=A0A1Y1U5S1_9TREE|nr:RNA12 protein-domain-containing protein [Kockovaella imperatae]ORX33380.1 RNA12 protein-domain-containing protein [Kockovaella imperatae]
MLRPLIYPLKHPLRRRATQAGWRIPLLAAPLRRLESTSRDDHVNSTASSAADGTTTPPPLPQDQPLPPVPITPLPNDPDNPPPQTTSSSTPPPSEESRRIPSSLYISNVFPITLGRFDPRPALAFFREQGMMERLHDIASEISGNGFRVESWEIARKDGGVFLHFSYIPPPPPKEGEEVSRVEAETTATMFGALPEVGKSKNNPARFFIPQFIQSAQKHGGIPHWLGEWGQPRWIEKNLAAGHTLYSRGIEKPGITFVGQGEDNSSGTSVLGTGSGLKGVQELVGNGRVWLVKGRQWTEDMHRFPSPHLRVEFEGPDVSQEMLYVLFRPYGRLKDIVPPSPAAAGSLRAATVTFGHLSPSTTAINCLHGYSTPTNTADFIARITGDTAPGSIALSRLRIYYESQRKAHAIRDFLNSHPRIVLPALAFLIGTLSYTLFDPIRAFFVRSNLEGVFDLESYSIVKMIRSKFSSSFSFGSSSNGPADGPDETLGKNAWKDRVEAEKTVERWLSEYPSTFITITGPPGSGKASLVSRVLGKQAKPSLVIDCSDTAKAKTDSALLSALAEQTGYWPVFSFLNSLNGLIDLVTVGLIGQKAGFATPIDQQLRSVLDVVGTALKDVSAHTREKHQESIDKARKCAEVEVEESRRQALIRRGGWHDGRLDCIAGNGVMSELGLGQEPTFDGDLAIDNVIEISEPATAAKPSARRSASAYPPEDLDVESEYIQALPIVVLKNFAQKSARGELWTVLSEWGAGLVENKIAHVIVITEGPIASKSLTKALPSKPLNTVSLADADYENSLSYVRDKLESSNSALSLADRDQITKLGGRMVDLETLVYKVRTGASVPEAVDDIVLRNVVELRKLAFGDDAEDAKSLPWTRQQAWKVVSELAKNGELSYAKLLQDFPFKGSEQSLKALEEHELVSITYVDGRASKVKPGKPVFRYAFEQLVNDPVFRAMSQIEYNTALIAKAEADIKSYEAELGTLKSISTGGGEEALGLGEGFFSIFGKSTAVKERARWLLEKMGKSVDKLAGLEKDNAEMMKLLTSASK